MMRFLRAALAAIVLLVAGPALAQEFKVPPFARIVDQAAILSPATRAQLDRLLEAHERKSSDQVVVVTLASLGGRDIAEIGLQLGRAWELGTKQNGNGVLLVVAPKEKKIRIEVGYGLEGSLPDGRAFQIIDGDILPRFKAGDLDGGVVNGVMAILASIEGSYVAPKRAAGGDAGRFTPLLMVLIFMVVMIVMMRYGRGGGGNAGPWGMRRRGYGIGGTPIVFLPSGRSGGGFGSGGGGFSGGGGSFGGGGASGSW